LWGREETGALAVVGNGLQRGSARASLRPRQPRNADGFG